MNIARVPNLPVALCGNCQNTVMLKETSDGFRPMHSKYWRQDVDGITVFCGAQCSLDAHQQKLTKELKKDEEK